MSSPLGSTRTEPIAHVDPHGQMRRRRLWIVVAVAMVVVLGAVLFVVVRNQSTSRFPPEIPGTGPEITVSSNQILRGGQPWWFVGYNSYVWSADCGFDTERMTVEQVDEWFASMRKDGHGAVRLFFFRNWNVDRLDMAIAAAKKNNVYVTITLDDAIGGCGETDKDAAWFDDPQERADYREHMTTLLERYKGEPMIAWFEFFNEPTNADGKLRPFFDEMGAVADTIDPDRLFASGTIAPYDLGGPDNFRTVHESPGVDLASLHEYDFGEVESNQGPKVRASSAGKPVIVGEFGVIDFDAEATQCPNDLAARAKRVTAKVTAYITTEGYVGAFAWAWQPRTDPVGCTIYLHADPQTQQVLRDIRR